MNRQKREKPFRNEDYTDGNDKKSEENKANRSRMKRFCLFSPPYMQARRRHGRHSATTGADGDEVLC